MKKWIAAILAAVMCLSLLTACGAGASESSTDDASTQVSAQEEETAAAEEAESDSSTEEETEAAEESAEEEPEEESEEMASLKMLSIDFNGTGEAADHVVEAVNAITEEKINTHVDIEFLSWGEYVTQISLIMAAGEQLDLVGLTPVPGASFLTMYAANQLMDISSYLQEDYAAGMMEVLGSSIDAYTVNGGIYGVPAYRDIAASYYVLMRKDILDELGMTEKAETMTTWEEYEEIMYAVRDAYSGSGFYAISKGDYTDIVPFSDLESPLTGEFTNGFSFDNLSDTTNTIFATLDGTVMATTDSENVIPRMEKIKEWYDAGLVYPDSAFDSQNLGFDLMRSDVTFSFIEGTQYGVEEMALQKTGYEVVANKMISTFTKTSHYTNFGIGVTVNSEDPAAAVRFLNLMYTDESLINTLVWGVEGVDYVIDENGVAQYPDGDSTGCWHNSDVLYGNQFLVLPFGNVEPDYRTICLEATLATETSPFLGFTLDTGSLTDTVANLTAVYTEYASNLRCGGYTEEAFQEYQDALDSAGLETYIAAAQEQLDAWLAQ